ncbi:MAG: DUF3131 domain-containing protein [Clostridia bacterium]|nr:DUF3131 domain-containing protein [Clostridia bacterium]
MHRHVLTFFQQLLQSDCPLASLDFLRENSRSLLMPLMYLHQQLRRSPSLPRHHSGVPRLLLICQQHLLQQGSVDAPALLALLSKHQADHSLTLAERLHLPLGMQLCLAEQLHAVLHQLSHCVHEHQAGQQLARRLTRTRKPMALLEQQHFSVTATQSMLTWLRAYQEHSLLAALEERMGQDGYSSAMVAEQHAQQQSALIDQLSGILQAFRTLDKLDWPTVLEPDDPLHLQLLHDPSDTYPRMDADSRMLYRQRIAALARLFRTDETRLARELLVLCAAAEPDGLHDHTGWYLLEPQGMHALQHHLGTRRGTVALFCRRYAPWLYRISLGISAVISALLFLHSGHPLFMLPVFLGVASCLTHLVADSLVRRFLPPLPRPRMQVDHVSEDMRTLVVIPTVLRDHSQVVPMVRRLLLARKAFPEGAIDCLLLADYGDSITQTSSSDQAIITAGRMAVEAIDGDGGSMMYFQRRRVWDADQRCYIGRERKRGALESLNQLIVHGECADEFDAATVPPSFLHRRYAYVLTLDSDTTTAPDAILPLIGTLSHPLNERRHTAEGVRGISILQPRMEVDPDHVHSRISLWEGGPGGVDPYGGGASSLWQQLSGRGHFQGKGLYRPDALLEATEGWILPDTVLSHDLLEGELSGCAQVSSTALYDGHPSTVTGWLKRLHRWTRGDWQLLPWLFSHVKTPGGVRRNPLASNSRYHIRQNLRHSLIPVCQLLLMLYAVLARNTPLALFALLVPEFPQLFSWRTLAHWVHLPLRAAIRADAILRALWRSFFSHQHRLDWQPAAHADGGAELFSLENWSQGLAAILFAVAALADAPLFLPGLVFAAAFACFPLMHIHLDAPLHLAQRPTKEMATSLMEIAESTWRFFEETVTEADHHLPPDNLQVKPWRGLARRTSPTNIGMYLLSCLAARELGIISTEDMCRRIRHTMDTLEQLPLWHGLSYNWYATDTLAVMDPPFISSVDCGNLCACLIAVAQGLRACLPEMAEEHRRLSHQVDSFAAHMELHRLFDHDAQLFSIGYDTKKEALDAAHYDLFACEAQLLSFVAVMRRDVPLRHFARLNRTLVRTGRSTAYISWGGTAFEYLMPRLLLPTTHGTMMSHTLQAMIRAQHRNGVEGMFGISESGWWGFDPQMNYQYRAWGLPELALGPCGSHPVIAPYAAALCLPFALEEAHDSLMRLRSRGMLGRLGYYESIDFDPAHLPDGTQEAIVQSHMAHHQGMLLCALCNALTDQALVRHFASVPAAAAASLLLKEKHLPRLTLPPRIIHPENIAPKEPPFRRSAQAMTAPVDAHVIGSPEAMLLMSAQGLGVMRSRGIELTRFTGDPTQLEGIQFYLNDGLTTYRLTDPALPGDTLFSEGSIRFIRTCGSLQTTLTALTDPVQGSFLHVVEVANLAARECIIDLASCLVPELRPEASDHPVYSDLFIETARPEERVLTVTRRPKASGERKLTLCHAISTHEPLLALAAQTDRMAFQGRNHTLHQPVSLRQPLQDGLIGAPVTPCASFRARLKVGGRGKAAVIFVTRLMRPGEAFSLDALTPRLSDLNGLLTLSRLLSRTMTDSLPLPQSRAGELTRLFGPLLWRSQPHQGAVSPLMHGHEFLRTIGLDPHQPLLTLMLHSDACASLVTDAADAVSWLGLMGQKVQLCILCEGDQADRARMKAQNVLMTRHAALLLASDLPEGGRETLEALSRVILYEGAGTVTAQLEAQSCPLPDLLPTDADPQSPPLEPETLRFDNGIGGFQPGTDDYVIRLESGSATPAPWCSLLSGERFGTLCMESGLNMSFAGNSHLHRLTPWSNDPVCPTVGEAVYLAQGQNVFTPTPMPLGQGLSCRVQYTPGVTVWRSLGYGLDMTLTAATIPHTAFGSRTLRLKNMTKSAQSFTLVIAARFVMGRGGMDESLVCLTPIENGVVAHSPLMPQLGCLSLAEGRSTARIVSPLAFHGFSALPNLNAPDDEAGTLALLEMEITIPAGGSEAVTWLLGACRQMDDLERLLSQIRQGGTSVLYRAARQQWASRLDALRIATPDDGLNLLINRILPWQTRVSRLESRCGFYQAGGAIGFRDQLQDMTALTLTEPQRVRAHLLNCTRHQYVEGDVQHWWHPQQTGVRTRIADDRLFLPFMACWYIQHTGDAAVLQEQVPWLLGEPVPDGQEDLYHTPPSTQETDSLHTHCIRALTSIRLGPHGLPLMDGGDWNDGMNRVRGESIWLALFYAYTLKAFAEHCDEAAQAEILEVHSRLVESIERFGWDGSWYMRAFFEDGMPLGSAASPECRIDSLCQSWAVLALGVTQRTAQAVDQAWQQLYDPRRGLMKLLTPPFDGKLDAGYIGGYLPGIRENGGQYTHAAAWMLWALCELGWADRAWELVTALNPIRHGENPDRYRLEPYALAGDIYTNPQQMGRGGWSHYTGSAAWLYTIVVEKLLGLHKRGDQVRLHPMVPPEWDGFTISLQVGSSTWHFHAGRDIPALTCDGEPVPSGWVTLRDDGHIHEVRTPLRRS